MSGTEEEDFELDRRLRQLSTSSLLEQLNGPQRNARFSAARELHLRGGGDVFLQGAQLCGSADAIDRELGAYLLGQLGTPKRPYKGESELILLKLALRDEESAVRAAAVTAMAHLDSTELFATCASCAEDGSPEVRASVAFGLGRLRDPRSQIDALLLKLTHDTESIVRDWAAFSFSMIDTADEDIRRRFLELLRDGSESVRSEAIKGLAHWGDMRVLAALKEELERPNVYYEFIEAAGELGSLDLLPRLWELAAEWGPDAPPVLRKTIEKITQSPKRFL